MNAVIYARYSSDNQREESIEGQLRECAEFAEKSGFTVLQHYIDRAYSATTDNRPEFQRMIKDSDKKLFDVIIVWKLDRFSRNRYDSAKYKNQLNKNGVKVISATESITDSPEGILMESLLEGWAEYYSKDLSVKVSRGLTENIIKGKFNGGIIPPGYMVDENQHIQIDPIKAPFVLEAFKRYARGDTKSDIVNWLNENGFTNSKGTPMSYNTIGIMLKNRRYIGEYKFRDHINYDAIPPIVTKDLFERVQMRLEKNKKAPAHFKAEEEYILSSKLVCGHCETYMCGESGTSHTGATYHYYKCMAVKKKKKNCRKKTVRKDWIEDIVINEITKIIFDDDTIEAIVSMVMKIQSEDNKAIPVYEKQLSSVQKSIDNTLNAIKMGIFTESTKQMLEELEQQKKYLSEQIAVERLRKPLMNPEKVRNWLYKLRTLNPEKIEHRRVLVDTFVNKIFLYDDKMIFTFNYKSDTKEVTFKELNSSDLKTSTAAICADGYDVTDYETVISRLENAVTASTITNPMPPLFESEEEYISFASRHRQATPALADINTYSGKAWLGIDAGSTTTKVVLMAENGGILYSYYNSNKGNPVAIVKQQLDKIYSICKDRITIAGSGVTGYGEELIKNAFSIDYGLVETVAHLRAARHFQPQVDFIIDIGGQDMKCFKIRGGAVDSIMLNEACSSGCGSFIETFAKALGYDIASFAKLGLYDKTPVNLGSRCTVFMNSSVKQAQKDGASVNSISAGLSISVVKNAIYKVIRAASADDLGKHIVVQGGTFLNDAVLRSFEQEIGRQVVRPTIAGLMGAYGAALYAKDTGVEKSNVLTARQLENFTHTARPVTCNLCTNHCSLTVNTFDGGRRFISGNRCSRPLGKEKSDLPNIYQYKLNRLKGMQGKGAGNGSRGKIGLPFGLNMYENLPFWHRLFTKLNFEVVLSPVSDRGTYLKGQRTIPSDTVCYPAKLMHGHVQQLIDMGIENIFYPCMSYNFDEGKGDNNYNCPVVAYYPELLAVNMPDVKKVNFMNFYVGLHKEKDFKKKFSEEMFKRFYIPKKETVSAVRVAYTAYRNYKAEICEKTDEYIKFARENGKKIIVMAGRPYHIDPEINHGIDELISSFDLVVISEDGLSHIMDKEPRKVLNQWTYQTRMYQAARYVCTQPDMQLVQLVSFGCGIDAITTDELRDILENGGKLYTQLKIDDISNLGAVKIRIRSLIAAIEAKEADNNG